MYNFHNNVVLQGIDFFQRQFLSKGQAGQALGFGKILFYGDIHNIPLPSGERRINRWFYTDAGLERDIARQLSWNRRTFPSRLSGVSGQGMNIWNASALKDFKLTEHFRPQFRTEF